MIKTEFGWISDVKNVEPHGSKMLAKWDIWVSFRSF
jgi:hypothetical protein